MTYFSQFPQARIQTLCNLVDVDENPIVDRETKFYIDCLHSELQPNVEIFDLYNNLISTKIDQDPKLSTHFIVFYTPKHIGIHKVFFLKFLKSNDKFRLF